MAETPNRWSRFHLPEQWALPAALALAAAFYGRLLTGSMLFGSDMLPYVLGQKQLIRDALWNGRPALYDPYTLCGSPLLANITAGVLYPANLLLLAGSPVWGVHLFVVVHYVGAAAAFFALMRKGLETSAWVSATAAAAYSIGGYAWSMADHWYFPSLPWLPLFFLGLIRLLRHRMWDTRRWWVLLSALSLALLFVCGNFQQGYDAAILGGVLMLFGVVPCVRHRHWREAGRMVAIYAIVVLSAALLASPQLLPTAITARHSYRAAGLPLASVQKLSFPPERLAEVIVPFVFGLRDDFGSALRHRYGGDFPWSQSVFVGLALIAGVVAAARREQPLGVRWGWFVLIAGFALAAGKHLPFYRAAYVCLPGFDSFRHPEKYLLWVHLSVCFLGAWGLDQVGNGPGRKRALAALGACAAVILALLASMAVWRFADGASYEAWLRAGGSMWSPNRMLKLQLFQGTLCLAEALVIVLLLLRRPAPDQPPESRQTLQASVFAVTALHLVVLSTAVQWSMPRQWLEQTPTAAEHLESSLGHSYRLFADDTRRTQVMFDASRPAFVHEKLRKFARLTVNTPSFFGLRAASGFSPLASRDYLQTVDFRQHNPMLIADLCASRYVILDGILDPGDVPPGNRIVHVDPNNAYTILENATAYPRIYTADPACTVAEPGEAAETAFRMAAERHRLAEGARLAPPPVVVGDLPDHYVPVAREHTPGLSVKADRAGHIEVACTGPAWLVVRDWHHPGWRAHLDDRQPVEISSVDGGFMGVFVPVGRHSVSLRYSPPGLKTGMVFSVLGVLLLLAAWLDPLVILDTLRST